MRLIALAAVAAFTVGCASTPRTASAPTPAAKPAAPAPKGNRFNMTQNGERMTADDFDAWMKARGIRIAKGRQPAQAGKPKPAPKRARGTSTSSSR